MFGRRRWRPSWLLDGSHHVSQVGHTCVLEGHDAPTRSILGNHTINEGGFNTVDDIVARTGYEMAISQNLNVLLDGERQASASEFGHDGKRRII